MTAFWLGFAIGILVVILIAFMFVFWLVESESPAPPQEDK